MKKLKDQRLKQFGWWVSSALSVATVLSSAPADAEDPSLISDSSNLGGSSKTTFKLDALQLPDLAYSVPSSGNLFITNFDADADETVLNDEGDRVSDISDESLRHASAQVSPAVLEEPVHSAEALTQPTPLSDESSTEAGELVPLNPIAQADDPSSQPSESFSEPSSGSPPAEPSAEPSPEPQPSELTPTPTSIRDWQFSVEPYFFAPFNVNADVTVSGRRTSLDLGLGDILNFDRALDAGLRLEAQNDRLGFILDGFYLYAENSGSLGRTFSSGSIFQFAQQTSPGKLQQFVQQFDPQQLQRFSQIGRQIGLNTPIQISADGTVSVRQIVIDAAVSYRVVDTSLDNSPEGTDFYPRLAVAPIVGVRTNLLRQTVEVDDIRINGRQIPDQALPPLDRNFRFSKTLVEPLVGAQVDLALSEQWSLGLRSDVSGFNIGARQNFTWNLIFGTQYNISPNVALQLAYRFNRFDFETGEGLRRTELSLRQNGLLLNAIFRF